MAPLVLIPLRSSPVGLSRLGGLLSPAERIRLATAMLTDVVGALHDSGLDRLVALAGDERAAAVAEDLDLRVHTDPPDGGLDTAVASAVARLAPEDPVAVVMPDLPRLSVRDLRALLSATAPVVVAPTGDGGTGALLRRPGGVIPTAYGPDSAARHLALAREAGLPTATVRSPGLSRDVDTPADLHALTPAAVGPATAAFLTWRAAAEESQSRSSD